MGNYLHLCVALNKHSHRYAYTGDQLPQKCDFALDNEP